MTNRKMIINPSTNFPDKIENSLPQLMGAESELELTGSPTKIEDKTVEQIKLEQEFHKLADDLISKIYDQE